MCTMCCTAGTIPSSLAGATNLSYVDLSNHNMTGDIPALAGGVVLMNLSNNLLDGSIQGNKGPEVGSCALKTSQHV